MEMVGFVFMPEHLHPLVYPTASTSTTTQSVEDFAGVPWIGSGRRRDTTSMYPRGNNIRVYR
jgi:hypothetical protein